MNVRRAVCVLLCLCAVAAVLPGCNTGNGVGATAITTRVRVVNLIPNAAGITLTLDTDAPVVTGLGFQQLTQYLNVNPGLREFKVSVDGGATTLIATTQGLATGTDYTLIVFGAVEAANMLLEQKPAGEFSDANHPFAKIQPFILKEIAGIKLAIVGVTTPGMAFWLWPEFTRGLDFRHPVEPVRRAIARAKNGGVDAIVLTGHMGLKTRTGGDDFANTVMALTSEFPEIAVFIAGHTHQDVPSRLTNGVLFTQADHFGIHVGRVDLLFDRNSKKLLHREAMCELMDNRFGCDQMVLSRSKSHLAESSAAVSEPIGELAETLRGRSHAGRPSDVERLIGTAIMEMLQERNVPVDGVMHGTFDDKADLIAGPKTVNDVWDIIPFENYVVTAQLSPEEIKISMEDVFASREKRNLLGFELKTEGRRDDCKIVSMALANRQPLDRNKKYVIALNSFDARSGGHHFMKLRAFLERPEANCILHPVQTRDALIGYFQHHKIVHRMAAVNPLAIAA